MEVIFWGAARMVTGSCYLLDDGYTKIMVDCGMFQGGKQEESQNFMRLPFDPTKINYVLLTHAHIDHSGRIPLLCKNGFKGKILATKATMDLCSIMLPDSGHIQEMEAEWATRKAQRAGKSPIQPLYTVDEAERAMNFFEIVPYDEIITLTDNISVRFRDAGHILGSAIIEIWDKKDSIKLVFSGDLGNVGQPIVKDPTTIDEADYVFIESTYGDRLHHDEPNRAQILWNIIQDTFNKKGNVIIPSFAVGRTQELLYELNSVIEKNEVDKIPVYIDSPLAIKATDVFRHNVRDYYDKDALNLVNRGDDPLDFPGLRFSLSTEDSKQLNFLDHSAVIISASGMCDAGRIKHHLKHNLWRPECSIVFVGFQAEGTLGRRIVDGEKSVKIFGEEISVKAKIYKIDSFSGHADRNGLLNWMSSFKRKPKQVFVVHGENEICEAFAALLNTQLNLNTIIPSLGHRYLLSSESAVLHEQYEKSSVIDQENIVKKLIGMKKHLNDFIDERIAQLLKVKDQKLIYETDKLIEQTKQLYKI